MQAECAIWAARSQSELPTGWTVAAGVHTSRLACAAARRASTRAWARSATPITESFFASLETELIDRSSWRTRADATTRGVVIRRSGPEPGRVREEVPYRRVDRLIPSTLTVHESGATSGTTSSPPTTVRILGSMKTALLSMARLSPTRSVPNLALERMVSVAAPTAAPLTIGRSATVPFALARSPLTTSVGSGS